LYWGVGASFDGGENFVVRALLLLALRIQLRC
jgi:hypothetical protein